MKRVVVLQQLLLAAGCTTVRPPDPATLRDPCDVVLLRGAGHLALVLPDGAGGAVRYGFGDRVYMSDFSWTQYPWAALLGVGGLFGEWTPGAMERIEGPGRSVAQLAGDSTLERHPFVAERSRVDVLRQRLSGKCGEPVPGCWWLCATNDGYSLWWDNCQNAAVGWCRELDCEITPWRITPRWATFHFER
ncbi:MAG: hypothetical protein EXS13_13660 [Planctomycetes bacterium]|nr:hypothetical protein [Planctomycetota bacterium]